MDKYLIENHKLIYHPDRILDWLNGKKVIPIYVEISPVNFCNHKCKFCAFDYISGPPIHLDEKVLKLNVLQMARLGVKSIMYSGEGEPLLYKNIIEIVKYTRSLGIDVAITTNGVFLTDKVSQEILPNLSWIRISINAGKSKTYSNIHGTKENDFTVVLNNLTSAVNIKKLKKLRVTIGVQILLLPENYQEIIFLAKKLKDIGVNYLIVKPYSKHPMSKNIIYSGVNYSKYFSLMNKLSKIETKDFDIIFRVKTMEKLSSKKNYLKCLGIPFWAYLSSTGDLYACSTFVGNSKFCYGNIYLNTFEEIWYSERQKKVIDYITQKLDVSKCRKVCRLDEINRYLWELKNPPLHVNFI